MVVRVLERLRRFPRDPDRVVHGQLPLAPEPVAEALALDERHGEPEAAVGIARIEHGEDVGVLQPGGELDLAEEAVGPERRGELGVEHLERDRAVVLDVLRQEHRGHPTAAELALERVAAAQAFLKLRAEVGHARPVREM